MKYLLSAILLGCLVMPARADKPTLKTDETKAVKIPFTLMPTGHFLVSVKLNDKGPYKLIFDTGAPMMLINNRIAKDSGVLEKNASAPLFSPFGAQAGAKAKTFEIGALKAVDVPMMVMDHPTVRAFSNAFEKEHGPVDGIVGFPFFARYKMIVDYQAKELTMTPNGYQPSDVMEALMKTIMGGGSKDSGKPRIVAATGLWGIVIEKDLKDEEAGVTIKQVMPGSAAEKAGLKAGDRLLTIDGRWTDSIGDTYQAASAVKVGKAVPAVLKREGKEIRLMVTPTKGL